MCIRDRGGEITTNTYVDLQELVRGVIRDIGYNDAGLRFDADSAAILNVINHQSPDIATVSYTHLRAHETVLDLVCRLLLEKKNTYDSYFHYSI